MKKIVAVAEISFFENCMDQKVFSTNSDTWKGAYLEFLEMKHEKNDVDNNYLEWIDGLPDEMEEARNELVNGEMDVVVTFFNEDKE